jgi:hypothetical protein
MRVRGLRRYPSQTVCVGVEYLRRLVEETRKLLLLPGTQACTACLGGRRQTAFGETRMSLPNFLGPFVAIPVAAQPHLPAAGGGSAMLDFTMQRQILTEWCWAATSASVCAFYARPPIMTQCEIATECKKLSWQSSGCSGPPDCCSSPMPDCCNTSDDLDAALTVTGNLAMAKIEGPLLMNDIATEINAGRPVCCRIGWHESNDQDGHFNVIYGYDDQNQDVDIADPLHPNQTLPLAIFTSNYLGQGDWDYSYKTK